MDKTIKLLCRQCRSKLDLTGEEPFSKVMCPVCGAVLRVPMIFGNYLLEKRDTCPYAHPSYAPQEAVEKALCSANSPLLLSDSGDNPTAGGIGCNTVLLRLLRDAQT